MPSSQELQAVTGQLYIIEGRVQTVAAVPGLLAQSAPPKATRSRSRDSLFVHLSLAGSPAETAVLTQDLLDDISRLYYQSGGSVTAALRQAVMAVNQRLLRLNLSGANTVYEGAITCTVLRGGELFIVQTGEALALLGHNFGIERLPPAMPDRITPLGRSAGLDIRFFHHRIQAGDLLLLADPRIAHLPPATLSLALVDTEIEAGLADLTQAVGADSARLLLVEFADEELADAPIAAPMSATLARTLNDEPAPQPRRERSRLPSIPQRARQPQPERPSPPQSAPRRAPTTAHLETSARKATSGAALGLSRFTGWLADMLGRLRPPRTEGEDQTNWAAPTAIAIIIPLILALVVGGVYIQRGRGQRFAEIKAEIGQNLGFADAAETDEALAVNYYNAVLTLTEEAELIRPGDPEIARLRQQARGELDRIHDITRLAARPLHTFDETVQLTAVTLQEGFNGGIYTLDGANGQVYRHLTDESYLIAAAAPESILFAGQAIGSHIVNNIIDIYWRPRGNHVTRDGLAALDSVGALLTFYPDFSKTEAVPLGFASDWQFPRASTPFAERLYILDTGARQVWKYFPEGDGFLQKDDELTIFFNENPELEKATDIAIYSEDGSLVVSYGDGRLRYYDTRSGRILWDEKSLLESGLNSPLVSPAAVKMVGKGLNASIFVADPGSGRIIEISRGGTPLAQYRATDENGQELFDHITDFDVVKTPLRVFVTAGNGLYTAVQE